jgi:GT2 family glycosyltransferase
MKDIIVTMVNTNEWEDIKRCLLTLFKDSEDSGLQIGVVIVDNASEVNIEPHLKEHFPDVTLIRQKKNEGFGASHNVAMGAEDGKYYFVLNPDTTVADGEGLLKKMYDWMEAHPKVGMIGPKILYPNGDLQYSCWRFPTLLQPIFSRTSAGQKGRGKKTADHFLMKDFDHNMTQPIDAIMGSAMFVRKGAAKEVGGFDERFWMYFEDIDWSRRMWEAHWPVYYLHEAVISHVHKRASAKVPGILNALLKNKYARVHLVSWLKYFWKWRGNAKYYG